MDKVTPKARPQVRDSSARTPKPTADFIKAQVHNLVDFAKDRGIIPARLFILVSEVFYEKMLGRSTAGYASGAEGLARLLAAEGGCVNTDIARTLHRIAKPVSRRRIVELIRKGQLIGYPMGKGEYSVPVWQFNQTGGVLLGITGVLAELRKSETYEPITPFAFLLQLDCLIEGKTPLAALREGNAEAVLSAARHYSN